ncbi:MAG: PKD domain-containing protein [Bacteroidia bacterium]|nr:PKD domain-containing protein [Bacteroidia bacterium]MDW8346144.1 PKD domain-containing protein [Bacteroidia bacterium]
MYTKLYAQIVGTSAFLKGNYVEVAVSGCGTYGTNTPAPAGYHPNVGTTLGFVADPYKNGWSVAGPGTFPNYMGDYFVPGSPEEGWGIQFTGGTYGNYNLCSMTGSSGSVSGSITGYTATSSTISATWLGTVGSLRIEQTTTIYLDSLFILTCMDIRNIGTSPVNNVYYMRNVDPDNEQPWTGNFTTTNTIVYQQPMSPDYRALVKAVGLAHNAYLGLGTKDPRARVSHGGFFNRIPTDVYNGTGGLTGTLGAVATADEAISIAFNLGNLDPGECAKFAYVYILAESQLEAALDATIPAFLANSVDISSNPVVNISKDCNGTVTPVTLEISPKSGACPITWTYTWSPATGLNTTTGTTVIASPSDTTIYTITGTDDCGTVMFTRNIQVNVSQVTTFTTDPPLFDINPQKICVGQPLTLAVPQSSYFPGYEYWTDFNGDNVFDANITYNPSAAGLMTYTYTSPGVYVLKYRVRNDDSCFATITRVIEVVPTPIAEITLQKDSVCEGRPLFIGNNSIYANAYEWSFLNSSAANVLPPRLDTTTAGFSITFSTPGTYTIKLVAKNTIGCNDVDTKLVTVIPAPTANVILSDSVVCVGDAVTFSTTNTGNYSWDFSETGITTPLYNVPNPVRVFTEPGVYTIGFTAYGITLNCEKTIYRKVRVLEKPILKIRSSDSIACVREPIIFKNLSTINNNGQATTYTWNFGDGNTSTSNTVVHVYQNPGAYWVKLTAATSFASKTCTYTDSIRITINEAPQIKDILANPDSAVATPFQNIQFTPVYTSNLTPNTFAWTFGDNSVGSNAETPTHTYADAGLYPVQLIITNKDGCKDTLVFYMRVIDSDSLFIPNIVTPNNDGKNDVFKVRFKQIKSYHIEIYNRWGTKVFESNDPNEVWDPIKEQDGVYYYVVICEGRFGTNFNRKGNITVMR